MQIDLQRDQYLSLAQAAALLPGRPHISTLHRWRTRGVRGVRLSTILIGGQRRVALTELHRFIETVTELANHGTTTVSLSQGRRRSRESAESFLDEEGV
jgi:hypothetical protein